MRFVIYGAGAIGGVIGGRLFEAGHDVTLIARGAHGQALRERGLTLVAPDGSTTLPIPVAGHPAEAGIQPDDVVVLAMKSQDTAAAVQELARTAPPDVAVVCSQNGVENERTALRSNAFVYGMAVMCPASHLEPGIVEADSSPVTGILDLGRYPSGVDDTARAIAEALNGTSFVSEARPDIMRWKYTKLLMNVGNAIDAICGSWDGTRELHEAARSEAEACLRAAGIAFASRQEDLERRGNLLTFRRAAGGDVHKGSSTWQSLARGTGSIETDYFNGEIVLLGRVHGIPTPVNALLQLLAREIAAQRRPPGSMSLAELTARVERETGQPV
jgi:2-dehydropantoate 2-reductase